MKETAEIAVADAEETLQRCAELTGLLSPQRPTDDGVSIAPRQAEELCKFINAHCAELEGRCQQIRQSDSEINLQLLTTRYVELEEALRFVQRAFVQPRRWGDERQVLLAADWLCVEGFKTFVSESESSPIGPLVAIDSSQSPAVWAPDERLSIPSLFQTEPKKIQREGNAPGTLAPFSLVCLPGHLARSPELYPLLSHEVGHAVDNAIGATATILQQLPGDLRIKYWRKWMREIFADAVAVTLSGEAFLSALVQYLGTMKPFEEVSAGNIYPGNTLRRALIGECLRFYQVPLSAEAEIPDQQEVRRRFGRTAEGLLVEFRDKVIPVIAEHSLSKNKAWAQQHAQITQLVTEFAERRAWPEQLPFVLMASLITLAQKRTHDLDTFESFRELHKSVKKRPGWVESPTQWVFSEEYLPSLRPTLLGADGQFKVPPLLLMGTYQKIAFVGATNWQLAEKMQAAFEAREQKPWEEIHLFFATDELLEQVEYGDRDARAERDKSLAEFQQLLEQGRWAKRWAIYRFNGPPIFASYWDWDRHGGRIHISPALLGTVIGECPSTDHIWHDKDPTDHYEKYVKHLECLLRSIPRTEVVKKCL